MNKYKKIGQKSYEVLKENFNYITYSKNVFIPLTNYCRNNCSYCGFNTGEKYILEPEKIKSLIKEAKKTDTTEALITFGEKPTKINNFEKKLKEIGYTSFLDYLKDCYASSLKKGILPHTNPGLVNNEFIEEIINYNASIGIMLENIRSLPVHSNSPGKDPKKRIEFLEYLGKRSIPTTTGLLLGIGETRKDRINSLRKLKKIDNKYGHIQEIIIQLYEPNEGSEYKKEPDKEILLETISIARLIFKNKEIQSPPNLIKKPIELIRAGASDLGGISEVTRDQINPERQWPKINELTKKINEKTDFKLKKRLPVHSEYINKKWLPPQILEIINDKLDGSYDKQKES